MKWTAIAALLSATFVLGVTVGIYNSARVNTAAMLARYRETDVRLAHAKQEHQAQVDAMAAQQARVLTQQRVQCADDAAGYSAEIIGLRDQFRKHGLSPVILRVGQ